MDRQGEGVNEAGTGSISETVTAESTWGSAPVGSPGAGIEHSSIVPGQVKEAVMVIQSPHSSWPRRVSLPFLAYTSLNLRETLLRVS